MERMRLLAARANPRTSVCKDCPRRAANCRSGCEAAAAEEILKIIRQAGMQPARQAAQDLGAIKTEDMIRRARRERRRG